MIPEAIRTLTRSESTQLGNSASIWLFSLAETILGGKNKVPSRSVPYFEAIARLMTVHHIGTVLDKASGMRYDE